MPDTTALPKSASFLANFLRFPYLTPFASRKPLKNARFRFFGPSALCARGLSLDEVGGFARGARNPAVRGCAPQSVRYGRWVDTRVFVLCALPVALAFGCAGGGASGVPCNADRDCLDVERCALGVCTARPVGDGDGDADAGVAIPATWTCAADSYDEGARDAQPVSCDCACGAQDPDCDRADAILTGCPLAQGFVCLESVCVDLRCGDGTRDPGEYCDDGNGDDGDGCTACVVDVGYVCTGAPALCVLACGNADLDDGEGCDDGNLDDGDGCSPTCTVEPGFTCAGTPSTCDPICGDGALVLDELCDGAASAVTCADVGPFLAGTVACRESCTIDGPASCVPPSTCGGASVGSVLGLVASGTTVGAVDDWQVPPSAGCGVFPHGSEDTSLFFTAEESATYVFSTTGSAFDTVLMILPGCTSTVLACHDDVSENDKTSRIEIDLDAGETVLVVIDGWNANSAGAYALYVETVFGE
jgi:cysteine-rich repeat protein